MAEVSTDGGGNFQRLLSHLDSDSLAYALAQAYSADAKAPRDAAAQVLKGRLEELREALEHREA